MSQPHISLMEEMTPTKLANFSRGILVAFVDTATPNTAVVIYLWFTLLAFVEHNTDHKTVVVCFGFTPLAFGEPTPEFKSET